MSLRIAVLGAGSWGTALALLLGTHPDAEITLWARSHPLVLQLRQERENVRYLPGFRLSHAVRPTSQLKDALADTEIVVAAVPSGAFRALISEALPFLSENSLLLSATKGLEEGTGLRMSQILAEWLPESEKRSVLLSGPNLAVEVARGVPTASVAASNNAEAAREIQGLFASLPEPTFRVYTGRDVIGVELGGAIKNSIAIGAGVCEGLGYGDNAKAGLMTRGLTEAIRLGVSQGAEASTFSGLSGVGDLIATGGSRLSRNYRVGIALGEGKTLEDALTEIGQVAEGVPTTRALHELALRSGVEMPLCAALHAVLFEGRSAKQMIRELMARPPREE